MLNTNDIKQIFLNKYKNNDFRYLYNGTVKTIEIQNVHFICDKDYIIRKPNYEYADREIQWYISQSLFVDDIPGKTPTIWEQCADSKGKINSNYGWCIWSNENGNQYRNCLNTLVNDNHTRQGVMIYTRPSMYEDANKDGRHDFMCTFAVQVFLNENENNEKYLDYTIYQRSSDAIFGFNNDVLWHITVRNKLINDLSKKLNENIQAGDIIMNAGSLHVYERHFKFLEENV